MNAPPTDTIADHLNVTLFFFSLAGLSFFEALKLEGKRAYVSWGIFAIFFVAGWLTLFPGIWPASTAALQWFGSVAASPFTWAVLLLLAYLMWRERARPKPLSDTQNVPVLDHQPEHSEMVALITSIERQLADVKADIDARIAALGQRSDRLEHTAKAAAPDEQEKALQVKMAALAETIDARERVELVKGELAQLDRFQFAPPPHVNENPDDPMTSRSRVLNRAQLNFDRAQTQFGLVRDKLRRLHFPMDGLDEAVAEAEKRVMSDARYLTLMPEDAEFAWKQPEEKRIWWLSRVKLDAQINYVRKLLQECQVKTDYWTNLEQMRLRR